MYQLAIFDMDGTILDTLEDLKLAINYALHVEGFPERSIDEVRRFVGNGIVKLVERAVPERASASDKRNVHEAFDHFYKVHSKDHTRAYEGIPEVIKNLRAAGVRTACVSNKPDYGVQALVKEYFPGLFDFSVGGREGIALKPAPDSVYEVLKELCIPKSSAVYIGDSDVDLKTAENAGLDAIAVLWGFRDREFLISHGAKVFAEKPEDLFSLIAV